MSEPEKRAGSRLSGRAQGCLKIGLAVLAPLVVLLLLEAAGYAWERRLAEDRYAWELVAARRIEMVYKQTPGAGYSLMKAGQEQRYRGIPVKINPQGLRSPTVTLAKEAGVYRVLNLGDSVAMGWGVREEETYGQVLAGMLEAEMGRPVQVINAAVPGWNLENELAYLQDRGLSYEPDLILLDLTLPNDQFGESALKWDRQPWLLKWLRDKTHLWPFLMMQLKWARARASGAERIDLIDPPRKAEQYFPTNPDDPRWEQLSGLIEQIVDTARERDIPLVMVLFPVEFQVTDAGFSRLAQEMYGKMAIEMGAPVVDLLPGYREACQARPGGACEAEDGYLFADVWMHPSALGHRLAAQEIYQAIQDMQ